jgi:hypothetical protein
VKGGLAALQTPAKKCDFAERIQIAQGIADQRLLAGDDPLPGIRVGTHAV